MAEKRGLETENGKADTAISFAAATSISLLASQWWNIRENILEMLAVMRAFIYFVQSQGGGWTAKVDSRVQGFESKFPQWVLCPRDCSNYGYNWDGATQSPVEVGNTCTSYQHRPRVEPSPTIEDSLRMGNDWKVDCCPKRRSNWKKEPEGRESNPLTWCIDLSSSSSMARDLLLSSSNPMPRELTFDRSSRRSLFRSSDRFFSS